MTIWQPAYSRRRDPDARGAVGRGPGADSARVPPDGYGGRSSRSPTQLSTAFRCDTAEPIAWGFPFKVPQRRPSSSGAALGPRSWRTVPVRKELAEGGPAILTDARSIVPERVSPDLVVIGDIETIEGLPVVVRDVDVLVN